MKRSAAAALLFVLLGACGSDGSGTGGAGGSTSTCAKILAEGPCASCVEAHCCDELAKCNADPSCLDCATGDETDPVACGATTTKALHDALQSCTETSCKAQCTSHADCNPVTNQGCDGTNYGCDLASDLVFHCFPPSGDVPICGACSNDMAGALCAPGLHCAASTGTCARFCCADGDCGSGTCDLTALGGGYTVGLCTSGGGSAACDAPATSPSNGSCANFTPGSGG